MEMDLHNNQGHPTIKLRKKASEGYFWAPCSGKRLFKELF